MKNILITSLLVLFASPSLAWTYQPNATITSVIMWENSEIRPLYFKRSDETWCYVPPADKAMHNLIMTLYTTEKIADIHCYDLAETAVAGVTDAHKVHRVIAK